MAYMIAWLGVLLLMACWSLTVWTTHAAAAWVVANADGLSVGGATEGLRQLPWPEWIGPWIPEVLTQGFPELLSGLGGLVEALLKALPALSGLLSVVAWGSWGLGMLLLLGLGVGLHALIALCRRQLAARRSALAAGTVRPGLTASGGWR